MSFTDPARSRPGALIVMTLTATPAALTTIDLRHIPPGPGGRCCGCCGGG